MRTVTGVVLRVVLRVWLSLLGAALVAAAAAENAGYNTQSRPAAGSLSALTAGAVLLRNRSRWAMTLAVAAGLVALAALGIGETPMWAFVELLLVAFWTTEGMPAKQMAYAIAVLLAAGIAFDARSGESGVVGSVVSPLVIVGAPAFAGVLLRRARVQAQRLRELTAQLAEQRDRAAAAAELAERARIAREIHDVVAHTVTVMVVQAAAAEDCLERGHPAAAPVGAIRATGKEALAELRRVIGVLRTPSTDDSHPQPSAADLPALVAAARAGGTAVAFGADELDDLPPGLQLTVFRTIQESLTNARKHAPTASVAITVHRSDDALRVVIDDDGPDSQARTESGFGLAGLRERADLYGGRLHAGPRSHATGWRVQLDVPLTVQPHTREPAAP